MSHSIVIVVVTVVIVDNFQRDNAGHVTLEFAMTSVNEFDSTHMPFYIGVDFNDARERPFMSRRRFDDQNEIADLNVWSHPHPFSARLKERDVFSRPPLPKAVGESADVLPSFE